MLVFVSVTSSNPPLILMTEKHDAAVELAEVLRQLAAHYGLWLAGSVNRLGLKAALDAEQEAGDRLTAILTGKLERALGKEAGGLLDGIDPETLEKATQALRTGWLAADGVWFQAVEKSSGMREAKAVNDRCWTRFSPFEARRQKALLGLPEQGGIPALKEALTHRIYAHLNSWEFVEETDTSIVFRIKECRVQSARKRNGLADYPCKSGGMAEYTTFSEEIDSRFTCECIACPPDRHPKEWVCAWRFTLNEE